MSTNNITGDKLTTGIPSKEYRNNYDSIFRKKEGAIMPKKDAVNNKTSSNSLNNNNGKDVKAIGSFNNLDEKLLGGIKVNEIFMIVNKK